MAGSPDLASSPVAGFNPRLEINDVVTPLAWRGIFGNDQPIELDLGAGDGGFALAYAALSPQVNLLAVERLLGRVRKIEKKALRRGQTNLRVARLELGYLVRHLIPAASVSVVHILFPDPWPKRRHWPRRLLQEQFLRDLTRTLIPQGEIRFTTDHQDYFAQARRAASAVPGLREEAAWNWAADPTTDFQRDFEAEGRPIWRVRWRKS